MGAGFGKDKGDDIPRIPESVGEATIRYANQGITHIPGELAPYTNLTDLDLSGNKLGAVPRELVTLCPKLRRLRLSHNGFHGGSTSAVATALDPGLGKPKRHFLPKECGAWKQLSLIDVEGCEIGAWDDRIGDITSLDEINASYNEILWVGRVGAHVSTVTIEGNYFPVSWSEAGSSSDPKRKKGEERDGSNLTTLTVTCRNTEYALDTRCDFPTAVLRFSALTCLTLNRQGITELPDGIDACLPSLRSLTATGNHIRTFPLSLEKWRDVIVSIDLSENELIAVPEVIATLAGLESLRVASNPVRTIAEEIGTMESIREMSADWDAIERPNLRDLSDKSNFDHKAVARIAELKRRDEENDGTNDNGGAIDADNNNNNDKKGKSKKGAAKAKAWENAPPPLPPLRENPKM